MKDAIPGLREYEDETEDGCERESKCQTKQGSMLRGNY